MRKWLLVGVTLAVMAMAFGIVVWTQREVAVVSAGQTPTAAPRPAAATTQFGSISRTESAWVVTFDKRTGLPLARFRGAHFTPRVGDQLLVEAPQVEFFLRKDRSEVMRIVGKTGVVTIPGEGPRIRSNLTSTPVQPPTRGDMTDVVVTHYPNLEDARANRPDITMTLAKAYFDSEIFEIATEEYVDAGGRTIAAHDVPVTVHGDAFEFEGKGLTLRWDENDQRLKSLVVYQGIQLLVKRPGQFAAAGGFPLLAFGTASTQGRQPIQLVAADPKQAVAVAADSATNPPRIYRATFHDGVKVTQEDQTLATAHDLKVDFPEGGSLSGEESTANAEKGHGAPPAKATPNAAPGGKPVQGAAASSRPVKTDAAGGAKGPAGEDALGMKPDRPVIIRCGGQFTVEVAPDEAIKPESDHDAVLRFVGEETQPVVLYNNGGKLEAPFVTYQTAKQYALVDGAAGHDVLLTNADAVLCTPQMRYSQQARKALLLGPSSADVVTEADGKKQTVKATWKEKAVATFAGAGAMQEITQLSLKGDVNVQQERLKKFNAGLLTLDFASKRQIKQIYAQDGVDCTIVDEKKSEQNIKARELKLGMAQDAKGGSYPAHVDASGDVVAGDAQEQIRAQSISADLEPPADAKAEDVAAKPQGPRLAGLRQVVATGDVELTQTKDGVVNERVKASRLQVRQSKDRSSWVLLEGAPASVMQGQTLLAGPFIEVDTATQKAVVTGGGKLITSDARAGAGSKGQPVEVTWAGPGELDARANLASVAGNVQVRYSDAGGVTDEASADRVEIALEDKEPLKPADSAKPQASDLEIMGNKYARHITLLPKEGQDVRLQSLKSGDGGVLERQVNMLAMRLDCTLSKDGIQKIEAPATAQHPGRFLYVVLPAATRKPLKTGDPLTDTQTPGATAFAWRQMLSYDKAAGQIDIVGDVMVRHEPKMAGAKPFTVDAQTIQVFVADATAKQPGTSVDAMEVRRILMKGNPVHLTRDDVDMTAPEAEIDPATSMVYARGTPNAPVQVDKGRMLGSFELVEMNTKTNEMRFERGMATGRN